MAAPVYRSRKALQASRAANKQVVVGRTLLDHLAAEASGAHSASGASGARPAPLDHTPLPTTPTTQPHYHLFGDDDGCPSVRSPSSVSSLASTPSLSLSLRRFAPAPAVKPPPPHKPQAQAQLHPEHKAAAQPEPAGPPPEPPVPSVSGVDVFKAQMQREAEDVGDLDVYDATLLAARHEHEAAVAALRARGGDADALATEVRAYKARVAAVSRLRDAARAAGQRTRLQGTPVTAALEPAASAVGNEAAAFRQLRAFERAATYYDNCARLNAVMAREAREGREVMAAAPHDTTLVAPPAKRERMARDAGGGAVRASPARVARLPGN